jgi:hypothetical protein
MGLNMRMSILNKPDDYARGWRLCDCGYKRPLEARFDYPDEAWVCCGWCGMMVVDIKKEGYKGFS